MSFNVKDWGWGAERERRIMKTEESTIKLQETSNMMDQFSFHYFWLQAGIKLYTVVQFNPTASQEKL